MSHTQTCTCVDVIRQLVDVGSLFSPRGSQEWNQVIRKDRVKERESKRGERGREGKRERGEEGERGRGRETETEIEAECEHTHACVSKTCY